MRRTGLLALCLAAVLWAQVKEPKPGMNFFSKQQDIQLGKEAAAEVEKTHTVIRDAALQRYVDDLGAQLTRSRRASDFPYTFKVVADDSINAFALPGGPMFLNTGLFRVADNEAQLAGVMAHEISHVALRHGTNQVSKANLIQLPAMLGGSMTGGGMLGGLAQLGIGLGANSALLKFSRGAETQADTNGVLILWDAGLNPVEMARFFEKLQAASSRQGGVSEFFSSHPNPGNRRKNIEDLVGQLPRREFSSGNSDAFNRARAIVERIPPAPPKQKR